MDAYEHAPAHAYADEIVVAKSDDPHSPPGRVTSDHDDMATRLAIDRSPRLSTFAKRKRSAAHSGPREASADSSRSHAQVSYLQHDIEQTDSSNAPHRRISRTSQAPAPDGASAKSIILGYWRDSTVPDEAGRHAIIGFIDTRDRLRTRVHHLSRSGDSISPDYPFPSGGGSWVSFERVIFEQHLIGLNHNQIKEYVKIRTETIGDSETLEEAVIAEKAAVMEAMRRAATHPTANNQTPTQIAYGVDLPDYVTNPSRPEKKRRTSSQHDSLSLTAPDPSLRHSLQSTNGNVPQAGSQSVASANQRSATDLLPGTRPTKILLGYWRGSSEERVEDKHAVFGILGTNDMFRVKVTRETRDGRPVLGNYPHGAGALWIHYDEVEFEEHIRHLSRPEVKEYVRVRQRQIDEGEEATERVANEREAVSDAQSRVFTAGGAAQSTLGTTGRLDSISSATAANLGRSVDRNEPDDKSSVVLHSDLPSDVLSWCERTGTESYSFNRTLRGSELGGASSTNAANRTPSLGSRDGGQHFAPGVAGILVDSNRPESHEDGEGSYNTDRAERLSDIARRDIDRTETIQGRSSQWAGNRDIDYAAVSARFNDGHRNSVNVLPIGMGQHFDFYGSNGAAGGAGSNASKGAKSDRLTIEADVGRINKVWASQEASRLCVAGGEDIKILNGVKYERKATGPFKGKLVSPGIILSIDGEDYVEYRVLTKPTFF
ncbi:MAG: hypothetical protein SEPTF4163_003649 [Sporothrix epigloea]